MESWKRLESVIKYSELTINAFALSIGLKRAENLYQIKRGKNSISKDLVKLITTKYCNISKSWLLTGEGAMFINQPTNTQDLHPTSRGIPFYDSISENINLDHPENSSRPLYYVEIPPLSNCDFAIVCTGDSMVPEIPSGSIITLKETSMQMILPGEIYCIVTDKYSTVKYLRTVVNDESLIRLVPCNKERYDEAILKKEVIRRIFLVKGVISTKIL